MNDTVIIFRVPGSADDFEMWICTILQRRGGEPYRQARRGGREEAVDMADSMLWVYSKHEDCQHE